MSVLAVLYRSVLSARWSFVHFARFHCAGFLLLFLLFVLPGLFRSFDLLLFFHSLFVVFGLFFVSVNMVHPAARAAARGVGLSRMPTRSSVGFGSGFCVRPPSFALRVRSSFLAAGDRGGRRGSGGVRGVARPGSSSIHRSSLGRSVSSAVGSSVVAAAVERPGRLSTASMDWAASVPGFSGVHAVVPPISAAPPSTS